MLSCGLQHACLQHCITSSCCVRGGDDTKLCCVLSWLQVWYTQLGPAVTLREAARLHSSTQDCRMLVSCTSCVWAQMAAASLQHGICGRWKSYTSIAASAGCLTATSGLTGAMFGSCCYQPPRCRLRAARLAIVQVPLCHSRVCLANLMGLCVRYGGAVLAWRCGCVHLLRRLCTDRRRRAYQACTAWPQGFVVVDLLVIIEDILLSCKLVQRNDRCKE